MKVAASLLNLDALVQRAIVHDPRVIDHQYWGQLSTATAMAAAKSARTDADALELLAHHPDQEVRVQVARHHNLSSASMATLLNDPKDKVRSALLARDDLLSWPPQLLLPQLNVDNTPAVLSAIRMSMYQEDMDALPREYARALVGAVLDGDLRLSPDDFNHEVLAMVDHDDLDGLGPEAYLRAFVEGTAPIQANYGFALNFTWTRSPPTSTPGHTSSGRGSSALNGTRLSTTPRPLDLSSSAPEQTGCRTYTTGRSPAALVQEASLTYWRPIRTWDLCGWPITAWSCSTV